MKRRWTLLLMYCCLAVLPASGAVAAPAQASAWRYCSPVPGASLVSVRTSLIFRSDKKISGSQLAQSIRITAEGDASGRHGGSIVLSDDAETMIFTPALPFTTGESVLVRVDAAALGIAPLEYRFSTSERAEYTPAVWAGTSDDVPVLARAAAAPPRTAMSVINGVAVPGDFPKFTPAILKTTDSGKIFIGNWSWSGDTHYMMIFENDGTPYFYQRLPGGHTRDFKVQPTGTLTRRVYDGLNCFVEMDSQYTVIATLRAGYGYGTDEHEVQLTADHHCFLIGLDYHQVDMSKLVPGGNPNATVIGNTLQELDEHQNVVLEWRSWDHFTITDAVHENLTANTIDYVHMNSIAVDYDGNIIISSRHLNEITKINRKTGAIIWRLGGAHNQFRFANDPYGPSYQHDARPVPGKPNSYTMMDNGNFHTPFFSRAVEFIVDTAAMLAIKSWEYRHTPWDYQTNFMGNVQRLPNGNTFIDWADATVPKATEVTADGAVVYEANFEKTAYCYRAFRFRWESVVKVPYLLAESYPEKVTLIFNKFGDRRVKRYIVYGGLTPNTVTPLDSTTQTWIDLTALASNCYYFFRVTARDSSGAESPYSNEERVLVKIAPPGANLVVNGDFSGGMSSWQFNLMEGGQATGFFQNNEYVVGFTNGGTQTYSVQLVQTGIPLVNGKKYLFEFDAYASNSRTIDAKLEQYGGSYTNYSQTGTIALSKTKTHKSYTFTMNNASDADARVTFNLGIGADTVHLANVSVKQVVPSAVETESREPIRFALDQNYPNPFNPSTTVRYQLPGAGIRYRVSLQVIDLLGRTIAVLESGEKSSGSYQVRWNAAGVAAGMYLCTLSAQPLSGAASFRSVRKIILLK